jgi:uncharacterized membrane protein YkoI
VKTIAGAVGILMLGFLAFSQAACAQPVGQIQAFSDALESPGESTGEGFKLIQSQGEFPVSEADAADIARSSVPGSKVLKVKLLPSGVYAVTLKDGDNVSRVMVDATTGSIS